LSSDEKQKLISSIIVKRGSLKNPEDIFRTVYELEVGKKRSVSEWAAVLNACGRMNMPSMGISALLNPLYEKKIDVVLKEYKNTIAEGLRWLEENMDKPEFVKQTKKALFFIARDKINYKIVGTICSIKSPYLNKEFIVGFADDGENTKVSVRKASDSKLKASDLVIKAAKNIGEGGGHAQAAGAIIKKGKEDEFIKKFNAALK
jgi:single-stranded DNA-specific DHH superfamily exonuclease